MVIKLGNNIADRYSNNILNKFFNKALSKPKTAKTQSFLANTNQLSMYNHNKPKLGSYYAQEW